MPWPITGHVFSWIMVIATRQIENDFHLQNPKGQPSDHQAIDIC